MMKFYNIVVGAAISLSISTTTYATPIQIDFVGKVTEKFDALGNALLGVSIGNVAFGHMLFDDAVVPSLDVTQGSYPSDYANYTSAGLNWLSSSIVVNGTSYEAGDGVDEVAADRYYVENPSDGGGPGLLMLRSSSALTGFNESVYFEKGSSVNLFGPLNEIASTDILSVESVANLFKNFSFSTYDVNFPEGSYSPKWNAVFAGDISSVTISRLSTPPSTTVPEPSSIALLAAGLLWLAATRKRCIR